MTTRARRLAEAIAAHGRAALVTIAQTRGSAPREAGAWMVVRPDGGFHGTIGGGALEWEALALARAALADPSLEPRDVDFALGPELGQCCGGRVRLSIAVKTRAEAESADEGAPLLLFGAGHVGRALALALAPLPFAIRWIDERPDAFPAAIPSNATPVASDDPAAEVALAPPGALIVVMTHSHARDLDIVAAALGRADLAYVGLIGSATKRARFVARLDAIGLGEAARTRLICPIGLPGVPGKVPAAIAVAVAAQLLQVAPEAPRLWPSARDLG